MDTTRNSHFYRSVVEKVLNAETVPIRFENFANNVITNLEGGASIVSTSTTWDRGRDGVGVGNARGLYVLTSLRDDVDIKILEDLERIQDTTNNIKILYFCSSQTISEHKIDQLEAQLHEETDRKYTIKVLGSTQLTELAIQYGDLVERVYANEINDIVKVLTSEPSDTLQENGFRLAMLSSASETSDEIRAEVYRTRILDALRDGKPRTIIAVCKALSDALHLGRTIPESSIAAHLNTLVQEKVVFLDKNIYHITPAGQSEIDKRANEGIGRIIDLKKEIKLALENGIGEPLQIDSFNEIWAAFETSISYYFTARGELIVNEVRRVFGEHSESAIGNSDQRESLSFLEDVAAKVGATSTNTKRRLELEQAVKDIFSDRNGPAADWLIRISANFMSACAMGIEGTTARAINLMFSKTRLLLDTDVVLSLFGHGEPEHLGVETLVDRWRKMGGLVYSAAPVLEEVARHAFISEHDMSQVRNKLPGTAEDRAHLIGNAFVRSFAELMASEKVTMDQWREFMCQYRGNSEYDTTVVAETLLGDFGVQVLPEYPLKYAEYEMEVRSRLVAAATRDFGNDAKSIDKAKRDSRLYVTLIAQIEQLRGNDPGSACLLVSSARRLGDLQRNLGRTGDEQLVISVAGALYLLSLLPDVSLGLSAMKAFLFDERRSAFSGDFERTVLRVVRGSDRIMPFAKRASLMRSLRQRLITNASQFGERNRDDQTRRLEREAFIPENQARTLDMLTNALNDVGVESRAERELKEARKKVQDLEQEIERINRRNTSKKKVK